LRSAISEDFLSPSNPRSLMNAHEMNRIEAEPYGAEETAVIDVVVVRDFDNE
jgi:hypothetical protein